MRDGVSEVLREDPGVLGGVRRPLVRSHVFFGGFR